MRRKSRRMMHLRLAALALLCAVSGGVCLRLCAPSDGFWQRAGLLGFTFAGSPRAAGRTLELWLEQKDESSSEKMTQQGSIAQQVQTGLPERGEPQSEVPAPSDPVSGLHSTELQAPIVQPDWLAVKEVAYPDTGAGERYIPLAAGSIRNLTAYPAQQVREIIAQDGLPFAVEPDSAEPQVLIMHTHATECYAEADGWVSPQNNGRTTDPAANMVAVGAELAAVLNAAGICTVQDMTLHDHPSYNGSYGRSRTTVEKWLAAYPSIRIVLDVHRDAIETDGVRIKPTAVIGGQKAAQLMIISGADDGTMGMPEFRQNLRFAAALQAAVESTYDGLTRPVLFDYRNYNQQLTTGSLLLEIGGHGNTLEEAKYTARLVGQALAQLLRENA